MDHVSFLFANQIFNVIYDIVGIVKFNEFWIGLFIFRHRSARLCWCANMRTISFARHTVIVAMTQIYSRSNARSEQWSLWLSYFVMENTFRAFLVFGEAVFIFTSIRHFILRSSQLFVNECVDEGSFLHVSLCVCIAAIRDIIRLSDWSAFCYRDTMLLFDRRPKTFVIKSATEIWAHITIYGFPLAYKFIILKPFRSTQKQADNATKYMRQQHSPIPCHDLHTCT